VLFVVVFMCEVVVAVLPLIRDPTPIPLGAVLLKKKRRRVVGRLNRRRRNRRNMEGEEPEQSFDQGAEYNAKHRGGGRSG